MRSRAVRVTLLLLAVAALGTAAYLTWNIERRTVAAAETVKAIDWKLDAATRATVELRAAQQAYVAAGQSEDYWITRVGESIAQLQDAIADMRTSPLAADTHAALERAAQALTAFTRLDRRAREYASTGQKLLASDVIFSDGLNGTQQVLAALDEARASHAAAAGAAANVARKELATVVGGAAAVALLVLLLLTSPGRVRVPDAVPEAKPVPAPKPVSAARPGAVVRPAPIVRREPLDLDLKPRAASGAPPVPAKPIPPPELQDVADVCTQLARAVDASMLPMVLQRTALALDASGVVLWVTDPDALELVAVASHGYAPSVLARMGPIARDAENVTAAAFRTGLLQTVKGDTLTNGAIAAPLVNAAGCVGVLSAELRNDGERAPARLALAAIVAAQLATLTAPAARSGTRAAL